ncbi:hypothetical protein IWW52_001273 [Coemansia sp. RSA 2704]|nr:hypothetical protein IWW52_001273 [Coemansia sp. RSA 2704]
MYYSRENARGLARRRTINDGALYNSIITDDSETSFGGCLSDISEGTNLFGENDELPMFTHSEQPSQRRYLNKCIAEDAVDNAPRWSQTTFGSTPSSAPKARRRQSLRALGRRLSLSLVSSSSPSRLRANAQPATRTNTLSSVDYTGSRWSLQPRPRTSWLDSIKMRIKGSHRRQQHQSAEAAMPIVAPYSEECGELDAGHDEDMSIRPEPAPTSQYPRLRSQPSLCQTPAADCSPIQARSEVSFVPDTDNTPDHLRVRAPPRQPQRQPRNSRFLLPHRLSIASYSQYRIIN